MAYLLFEGSEYSLRISEVNENTGGVEFLIHNNEQDSNSVWANIVLPEKELVHIRGWIDIQLTKLNNGKNG